MQTAYPKDYLNEEILCDGGQCGDQNEMLHSMLSRQEVWILLQ